MRKETPRDETTEEMPFLLNMYLPFRIVVLAESITRAFAKVYEDKFGLSIFEGRIIAVIGRSGAQSTQVLIERTHLDRVRMSRAVIRLADKKLITRSTTPTDQRAQILNLTREGRAIHRKIVPLARRIERRLAGSLTAEERRWLESTLTKLATAAGHLDGD